MSIAFDDDDDGYGALTRWAVAAFVMASLHAGAFWLGSQVANDAGAPPDVFVDAIMIDLEPPAAPPEDASEQKPPEPTSDMQEPPAPAEDMPAPEADAHPDHATPPESPPEPQAAPSEPIPPAAVAPVDGAVLAPPTSLRPKPRLATRPRPTLVSKKKPAPDRTRIAKPAPRPATGPRAAPAAARAPPRLQASRGAPVLSAADRSAWQSAVAAHINRFKRAPANGGAGVSRVGFRIDAGGRVLSASLVGGSGDATLDAEAVALVRRASPVPAPPSGSGAAISLIVPVRFAR